MYSLDIVFDSYKVYNDNKSYRKTASILKIKYNCIISRQIIMIWIKNINNNMKNFLNKRANKLDNDNNLINKTSDNYNINIINDINNLVYNNPFITRKMVIDSIYKKYKIKLTLNYISKIYKKLKLTRKKPKYHVVKTIEYLDQLIIKRQKFKEDMSKIDLNKVISIDESSFNNLNNNSKGLSKKGIPINLPCNEKKVKNNSLICAISIDKIMYYEIHETSVNSDIFYNYINNLITKNKLKGYYFMLDNVRFHHCKKTLKLITDTDNNYIFTPPYSPNNNPIEVIFSIIKNKFKKIKKENIQLKVLIIISINKTKKNENEDKNIKKYEEVFKRSINYDYKDIEKELRDRLIIKK
jgi:transposase